LKKSFRAALLALLVLGAIPLSEARQSRQQSDSVAGVFDYYLLTLSWSPTFCLTHPGNQQCSGKGYGFVLHGLWPQYAKGGWPQDCGPGGRLAEADWQQGRTLFVTQQLLSHEWKTHGTCSGMSAAGYFNTVDKALAAVRIPPALQPSSVSQTLAVQQISRLFQQSNPGLPGNAISIRCDGQQLAEVRVCLSKDLGFTACGQGVRNQCRGDTVLVPAIR
jgi:ribonuclease T2